MSIKGLDTFFDVLAVIKNTDSFENRLQELAEATQKYEEAIKSVAGLQNVQDFINDIEINKKKAKELVEEAEKNIALLYEKYTQYKEKTNKELNTQLEELQKIKVHVTSIDVLNKKKEKTFLIKEKELNKKEVFLNKKEEDLQNLANTLEIRKQKIFGLLHD